MHIIYNNNHQYQHNTSSPSSLSFNNNNFINYLNNPISNNFRMLRDQQFRNNSIMLNSNKKINQHQHIDDSNLSDDEVDVEDDYGGDIDADDEDEENVHQVLNMLASKNKSNYHQAQLYSNGPMRDMINSKMTSPSATSQMINFKMKSSSTSHIPQITHPMMLNPNNNSIHHMNNDSHPTLNDISHLISSPHPDDAAEAPSISSPSSEDMSGDDMSSPPQHQNFSSLSLHSPGKPTSKFNQFMPIPSGGMMKSSSCSNIVPKTCNYNKCCICAYGPPPSFFTSAPTWADICYIALYCLTLSKPDIKYFHIKKDICTFIDSHYETMCMRKRTSIWRQTVNMTLSHPQYFEMFQQESALENGRKGYYGLKQIHDPYEHTALNKRSRRKRRHEQKMLQEEMKKSTSFTTTISASKNQSPVNQIIGSIYSSSSQASSPFVSPMENDLIPTYELASISQQYKRVKCSSNSPQSQSQTSTTATPQQHSINSSTPSNIILPSISGKPPIQSPQLQHHHHQQQQQQLLQQIQQHKNNFDSILNSDDDMPPTPVNSNKRPLSSPIEKSQSSTKLSGFKPSSFQDNDIPMTNISNSAQNTPSPIVKKFSQKTILPKLDDDEDEIMENEREVPRLYNKSPMTKLILEKNLPPLSPTSLTQNTNSNPLSNSPSPINSRSNSPCQQTPYMWQNQPTQMQISALDDDDFDDDDDDEDSPKKRMRKTTRPEEKIMLEKYYQLHYGSNAKHCKEELLNLSENLNWKINRIQRWLDNRRTKDKLKTLRASQERSFIYTGQQYNFQSHYINGQTPIPVVPNSSNSSNPNSNSKDRSSPIHFHQQSQQQTPQQNHPAFQNKLILQHSSSSNSINSLLN